MKTSKDSLKIDVNGEFALRHANLLILLMMMSMIDYVGFHRTDLCPTLLQRFRRTLTAYIQQNGTE